jgi:sporulation protein YlmC with PRC-barrel domain
MTFKRFMTATAIAAALAVPASAGFAQTATPPNTNPPTLAPAPHAAAPAATTQAARHIANNETRASKLMGSAVYDSADQKLGSISDLIVDHDGRVTDVVIGVGSFLGAGDKQVGVKMADLKRGKDNHLVYSTTKDALKQMPSYDLNYDAAARSGSSTQK